MLLMSACHELLLLFKPRLNKKPYRRARLISNRVIPVAIDIYSKRSLELNFVFPRRLHARSQSYKEIFSVNLRNAEIQAS